ncbi:hypothetical protein M2137_001871 [Parabacteroides sp. PFB2-10]|nr:hypothetical protein [Parabacteroides sp. PFB2-10]
MKHFEELQKTDLELTFGGAWKIMVINGKDTRVCEA